MAELEVNCVVTQPHEIPYQRIVALGGPNGWRKSKQTVIQEILSGENTFFVGMDGKISLLEVVYRLDVPYLRTTSDADNTNNLLNLGKCPE